MIKIKEMRKDLFDGEANRLQQNCHRHLATTVNSEIQNIFWIKFKIQPGATVRNHTG